MARSADLIQSNSQVYRVYSRRLANPADQDIFIGAARKLTAFLSDHRAYYPEAQQSIIEVLEIARNSLKNVAPRVFSKPGSLDKSAIPADKAPLFDAFDKLANSVTAYVNLFTNEEMKNRVVGFLSSIGLLLSREATPPDSPSQIFAPPSTAHQDDPTPFEDQPTSPIGTTSSDPVVLTSGLPPAVKGPTSIQPTALPTPTPSQVLSLEAKDGGNGAVVQLTPGRKTTQSPAGELLRPSPPSQAPVLGDVVKPVCLEPNRKVRVPVPSLSTSSLSSSLRIESSSPVLQVVPQSSQKIPANTPVTPSPASSNLTSQGTLQSIPPSLIPTEPWVAQALQSVPPPQVQTPIQSTSSAQNESKPPRRRQSAGLNFLQLDLLAAREKKLKAARLASVPQDSGSNTGASPGAVPLPSTKTALAAAVASPTSTTTAGLPNTPSAPTSMPTNTAATPARTTPLTVSTQAHTSAIIPNASDTAPQPQVAQTPSPSLVHRDLRQEVARIRTSGASPRKLRITDRAPAPPPEPGSASAPIVIDEDEQFMCTPSDEPMVVDAPMQALPQTEETKMMLDPQDVQGSNGDARHDQEVSSATGTSGVDAMAAQSSSAPSTSVPLSFYARPVSAVPSSGPSSRSASLCDKPSGSQLEHAKDGKERGTATRDSVGPLNNDIASGATVEPSLGSESYISTLGRESTHSAVGVTSMPEGKDTEMTSAVPATISSATVTTEPSPALGPIISVLSATVGSTSPGTVTLGERPPEKEGGSETSSDPLFLLRQVVIQNPSASSGKADVSTLLSPRKSLHPSSEPLSDMDISRASTPPIAVLETHSAGSDTTNPSPASRSITPPSGKRFSEARTEPAQAEELEDEVDELAPLFGKEMNVICMERAYDVPGEFTWDLTVSRPDWDRISQWAQAPENLDLDISQARCITLACYSMQELDPYVRQDRLARERWFENVKPVPWAKLPRHLWAVINDEVIAVFPPYMSPDDLFDLSPYLRLGCNKISFTLIDGMADYVLVLHGHRPTRGQLVPLKARWDQERLFRERLSLLSRPFVIDDW